MKDLLAVATVRRLLREMGYCLQPEAPGGLVGPLSLWVAESRPELDGRSPMQALDLPDGEARLRECLKAMVASHEACRPIGHTGV